MVYMTGTDLNGNAAVNIKQMEQLAARLPRSVKITVLWDQAKGPDVEDKPIPYYATGRGIQPKWDTAGYAVIQPDADPRDADPDDPTIATTFFVTPREVDTGNPATLANFEVWSRAVAPARHYALVMWDHGGGYAGLNYDGYDTLPPSNLTAGTLSQALANARARGVKLDLLAFDECLMATPEALDSVRGDARVLVGSEELVSGAGYDYASALGVLARRPSASALALAQSMVTSFHQKYHPNPSDFSDTLSTINPARLPAVVGAVRGFVGAARTATPSDWDQIDKARSEATPYWTEGKESGPFKSRDLGLFMRNVAASPVSPAVRRAASKVVAAVNAAVVHKTQSKRPSSGLAIYLPDPSVALDPNYSALVPSFESQTGWYTFLTDLRKHTS